VLAGATRARPCQRGGTPTVPGRPGCAAHCGGAAGGGPEFWDSPELRAELREGSFLGVDLPFFVGRLERSLKEELSRQGRGAGSRATSGPGMTVLSLVRDFLALTDFSETLRRVLPLADDAGLLGAANAVATALNRRDSRGSSRRPALWGIWGRGAGFPSCPGAQAVGELRERAGAGAGRAVVSGLSSPVLRVRARRPPGAAPAQGPGVGRGQSAGAGRHEGPAPAPAGTWPPQLARCPSACPGGASAVPGQMCPWEGAQGTLQSGCAWRPLPCAWRCSRRIRGTQSGAGVDEAGAAWHSAVDGLLAREGMEARGEGGGAAAGDSYDLVSDGEEEGAGARGARARGKRRRDKGGQGRQGQAPATAVRGARGSGGSAGSPQRLPPAPPQPLAASTLSGGAWPWTASKGPGKR